MSGDGEDYSDDEINDVYDAVSDAWEDHTSGGGGGGAGGGGAGGGGGGGGTPRRGFLDLFTITGNGSANGNITVTAKVEWAGEYANNGRGGERTVKLDRVDTRPIVAALRKARVVEKRSARGPLRSYTAKSHEAQLRQLNGTKGGREALKNAGFNPSRETLRRWKNGSQPVGKNNQRRIAEAYENQRNPGRGVMGARREVTNALTASLKARYDGQNIRFRDIRDFRIH
jgi:hypothetical protein